MPQGLTAKASYLPVLQPACGNPGSPERCVCVHMGTYNESMADVSKHHEERYACARSLMKSVMAADTMEWHSSRHNLKAKQGN